MKLLILHIGDIHIKDEDCLKSEYITKIADSLNQFTFDRMVICITGDIAFSGQRRQYSQAKRFIGMLIESIKARCGHTQYIDTICVPGNHDVDHGTNRLDSKQLQIIKKTNQYQSNISGELEKGKNFFLFSKKYGCFEEDRIFDRITRT